jgi:cystathionine beta-lyase/cystathionine gamma-synthase
MAFTSGMAAINTLMELFAPGDHIIASNDLYGGTYRLFSNISQKNGISFDLVNTSIIDQIESHITPQTRAIIIETPTNPMMRVSDIVAVSRLAKLNDLLLVVDNTFLSPYYQQPLQLGADVVIHSGTKYLGGHNDTLAGFLVVVDQMLSERLRFIYKSIGACLSPFDSWLLIRGIKTLAVRLDRQQQSAGIIAKWLCLNNKIRAVHYVGLDSHPDYEISSRQASGFGAMISFEVDSQETAIHLLDRVSLIQYAESLGGVETLITYPLMQTHADVPKAILNSLGINEKLLRLSVGLENVEDLIADLKYSLGDD